MHWTCIVVEEENKKDGIRKEVRRKYDADMYAQQQADFDNFDPERFDPNKKRRR